MKRGTILVVEDEPSLRDLYVQYLSMVGYEVDAKASGEEALEAAACRSYDLLLLDLRLSGMNGLTTLKHLRRLAPAAKAVVVSGSIEEYEEELEAARGNGLLGVLLKPFSLKELRALVDSAVQSCVQAA